MEITDLFADAPSTPSETKKEGTKEKSSSLKSSVMVEAMALMANPKKLKGIIGALILFLIIGLGSTIAFFIIYPIAILWAMGSYITISLGGRILRAKNKDKRSKTEEHVNNKRDH